MRSPPWRSAARSAGSPAIDRGRGRGIRGPCGTRPGPRRGIRGPCGSECGRGRGIRGPCASECGSRRGIRGPCVSECGSRRGIRGPCASECGSRRGSRVAGASECGSRRDRDGLLPVDRARRRCYGVEIDAAHSRGRSRPRARQGREGPRTMDGRRGRLSGRPRQTHVRPSDGSQGARRLDPRPRAERVGSVPTDQRAVRGRATRHPPSGRQGRSRPMTRTAPRPAWPWRGAAGETARGEVRRVEDRAVLGRRAATGPRGSGSRCRR
jgi:hypothetical protein